MQEGAARDNKRGDTIRTDKFITNLVLGKEITITPDFLEASRFLKEKYFVIEMTWSYFIITDHGQSMECASFYSLVKPPCSIPAFIPDITGVANEDMVAFQSCHSVKN